MPTIFVSLLMEAIDGKGREETVLLSPEDFLKRIGNPGRRVEANLFFIENLRRASATPHLRGQLKNIVKKTTTACSSRYQNKDRTGNYRTPLFASGLYYEHHINELRPRSHLIYSRLGVL